MTKIRANITFDQLFVNQALFVSINFPIVRHDMDVPTGPVPNTVLLFNFVINPSPPGQKLGASMSIDAVSS